MGRNAKRRKEVKKMKKANKEVVELNVKEIREKAIKSRNASKTSKLKYSVGSQIGNVVADNLIVRGPRF